MLTSTSLRALAGAGLLAAATATSALAQPTVPLVLSGYTDDVVANGVGPVAGSTTNDMDNGVAPNQFCFVAADFVSPSGDTPQTSLPTGGQIVSATAPFPIFQLEPYTQENSLRVPGTGSGTLTVVTPREATVLYVLAASGNLASDIDITITFTDNSTQLFPNVTIDDWFGGPNYAIQGVSRVNYASDDIEQSTVNPRLYQYPLPIAATNQRKMIQSVTFSKNNSTGCLNVMGISANRLTTGLSETAAPAELTLTPNPTSQTLAVTAPATGTIELLDLTGRQLLLATAVPMLTLDVRSLAPGVYLVRYADGRRTRTARFAKQ